MNKSKANLTTIFSTCSVPMRSWFLCRKHQLDLLWKEKKKKQEWIAFAASAISSGSVFPTCSLQSPSLCKTQRKIWSWKLQCLRPVLEWLLTHIPISQMKGATGFPGQKAGRTKAKPHNLLCSIRGEIFPEGKIQSILCNFLTSHESLQLFRDNSSFPIQLLN